MLLDRHRVAKLIELADLERRASGPERLIREEDVALLIKAAYDDATDAARAEFMARVRQMPTSAWPWSAVQAMTPRGGGRGGFNVVYSPAPGALAPAVLVLLRGQADSADADSGNRIPDRGQPGDAAWEPLHKALDLWDTTTIKKWIGPQGWMTTSGATAGQVPNPSGSGGVTPNGGGVTPNGGGVTPNGGGSTPNGGGVPPNGGQPPPIPPFSWRHPAVIVAGLTTLTTVGVTLYSLRQSRRQPAPLPVPGPAASTATAAPVTAAAPPATAAASPAPTNPTPAQGTT